MDEIWSKHKRLIKFGIKLSIIIVIWGIIEVVSAVQETNRNKSASDAVNLESYQEERFKAYNVEGLSDEEIDELLEQAHQEYENQEE